MAKLKHYEARNHCYFVTTTTEGRKRAFSDRENCEIVCNILYNLRARGKLLLLGFVVMPDHLHLLVVPLGRTRLSDIMRDLKKGSARLIDIRYGRTGKVWMDEYYDRGIRGEEQLMAALDYIHNNPVAAKLVARPENFPFSSANVRFDTDLALATGHAVGVETTPTTERGKAGIADLVAPTADAASGNPCSRPVTDNPVGVETTPTTEAARARK